jgi:membrane protein implicated in regulation of membrane protease activity
MAYNALKASALVAGVALAFALNPLLGVGAVAVAAAVLSGANALANRDNTSTDNLGVPAGIVTDFGTYTPPAFKVDQFPVADQFTGSAPKAGSSRSGEILGAGSAEELKNRLETIVKQMAELTFRMSTDGISSTAARAELDQLRAEMVVLTKQGAALDRQNQINITVNGAIDKEGTARTLVELLNNSYYRGGGGGANSLVIP